MLRKLTLSCDVIQWIKSRLSNLGSLAPISVFSFCWGRILTRKPWNEPLFRSLALFITRAFYCCLLSWILICNDWLEYIF
jgi:hypothetical protein